jgi:hypothetical protein
MSLEHSPARQAKSRGPARATTPPPRGAFTVVEFCACHGISRSKLYQLWQKNIGPRVMRIGGKILISVEAAADWRREREEEAEAQADNPPSEVATAGPGARPSHFQMLTKRSTNTAPAAMRCSPKSRGSTANFSSSISERSKQNMKTSQARLRGNARNLDKLNIQP